MSIYDTPNSSSIIPKFCKCDSSIGSTAAWCCNQCGLPTGEDYISNQLALKDGIISDHAESVLALRKENERLRGLLEKCKPLVFHATLDPKQNWNNQATELLQEIDLLSQSTDKP